MLQIQVITDVENEPISLEDAKTFLQIDYPDWDFLISLLIVASRTESEKITGRAYGLKTIQVTGNTDHEKIYPILPFISDKVWDKEDGCKDYRYEAGYSFIPPDLKIAVLMRVATGFSYRENGTTQAINMAVNASINKELKNRHSFVG
jgi:hypothetical protein